MRIAQVIPSLSSFFFPNRFNQSSFIYSTLPPKVGPSYPIGIGQYHPSFFNLFGIWPTWTRPYLFEDPQALRLAETHFIL